MVKGLLADPSSTNRPRGIVTCGSEEPNALVTVARGFGARAQQPRHDAAALRWAGGHAAECLTILEM